MYPDSHPYSWSTIGSMDDLNAASLDDVKEWYATYYGPNNCVLSLAGDITPERALELVNKYFGGIPPGPPLPRTEAWVPRSTATSATRWRTACRRRASIASTTRRRGATPTSRGSTCSPACSAARRARGSIAAWSTRRRWPPRSAPASTTASWPAPSTSSVTVKPGVDPAAVEQRDRRGAGRAARQGPDRRRTAARADAATSPSSSRGIERLGGFGGRSDVLAESMTYGGTPDAYLDRLERLATATPAEVKARRPQVARRATTTR